LLNIEIKGVQFSNKGAELMLVAILEQLDKELGEYQITLSPGNHLPYRKRARLGAWQKLSFRRGNIDLTGLFGRLPNKLLNLLKRYGIVTEKDVDIILDASGFAYGEQWGVKSLSHTAKEVIRFKQQGKKYIFLPQALGPFKSDEVRTLAKKVFSNADLVFPRDDESYQEVTKVLAELTAEAESCHIQQAPDFTCLVEPEAFRDETQPLLEIKTVCIIPNNKMVSTFHHKNASDDEQGYIRFLVQAGKYYQPKGWRVVLLNHEGKEDQFICEQIAKELSIKNNKIVIKDKLSAVGIKSFIGGVDAIISSRFHGCVSALTQGIPCLATSWSHKYQMLFQEYGVSQNVLDFKMTDVELEEKLALFTDNFTSQKKQCLQHADKVKKQTRHMWQQVFLTLKV
jgi:colanic acid/amylovoran biosynthesis protein